ncbi:bacterio-opsin activator domain-containing protein [Salinirussus salinus]|uniref:bacterio-opsin activator domain-containing protein n=1 Tax=Salinirussus salinus TaxID=1198300 RepID=UPI0013567DC3|nr:GAF domain-containing protein [Salinirussus salinus]
MPADVGDAGDRTVSSVERLELLAERVEERLVDATSRAGVDRTVRDTVGSAGPVEFVAVFCYDDREFTFRTAAGVDEETATSLVPTEGPSPGLLAVGRERTQVADPRGENSPTAWRSLAEERGVGTLAFVPVAHRGEVYRLLVVGDARRDAYGVHERDALDGLGAAVGRTIGSLQHRKRERTLEFLQAAAERLESAETAGTVYETAVEVATDVLDVEAVGVFRFDPEKNVLEPATVTALLREFYGDTLTFGPGNGDAQVWQAYATGETRTFDYLAEADRLANPDTDARSAVFVPLNEHGVLVAASRTPGTFNTRERTLVDLLASTATSALERVAHERAAREREATLSRQASRLERVEVAGRLVREVNRVLVRARSRAELEEMVCRRLTDEAFAFAWIGSVPPDGDRVEPRAWAGDGAGYLDDAPLELNGGVGEPAARAAGGEATCVDVTDHLQRSEWARAAAERGFQSACAVPLTDRGVQYGALAVYATDPGAFAEMGETLVNLGETVGYGINVAEARQGVLADRSTELELRIPGGEGFMNLVAATAGEPVSYYELTPDATGSTRLVFALTDPPVEELHALEAGSVAVESLTEVNSGAEYVFRVTVAEGSVAATLLSCGAIPEDVVAHPGETTATVRLPQERDIREFVARVSDHYPGTELLARQEVDGPARTRRSFGTDVDAALTDRQLEVLRTAYESGFFESPRETTGSELAELLGVSQPTVTRHLREGQRRVFALLFDDPAGTAR